MGAWSGHREMGAVEAWVWGRGSDGARCLQRVGGAVEVVRTCSCGWSPDRSGAREAGAVLSWEGAVPVVGVSGQSPEGGVALGYILRGIGNSQVPKEAGSCMP